MAEVAEAVEEKAGQEFIGAEIHIIADPKTGGIHVNAPMNKIIAFGLLEVAKMVIETRGMESQKKPVIDIVPAGAMPEQGRPS